MAAVAEKLLVVQCAEDPLGNLVRSVRLSVPARCVCATVGRWLLTGSPFRKAIACASWKSSFEPSSIGLASVVGGRGRRAA